MTISQIQSLGSSEQKPIQIFSQKNEPEYSGRKLNLLEKGSPVAHTLLYRIWLGGEPPLEQLQSALITSAENPNIDQRIVTDRPRVIHAALQKVQECALEHTFELNCKNGPPVYPLYIHSSNPTTVQSVDEIFEYFIASLPEDHEISLPEEPLKDDEIMDIRLTKLMEKYQQCLKNCPTTKKLMSQYEEIKEYLDSLSDRWAKTNLSIKAMALKDIYLRLREYMRLSNSNDNEDNLPECISIQEEKLKLPLYDLYLRPRPVTKAVGKRLKGHFWCEARGLGANYAAASDIFRYILLYMKRKKGEASLAYYADFDVALKKSAFAPEFLSLAGGLASMCGGSEREEYLKRLINNNLLASEEGSVFLGTILNIIDFNYTKSKIGINHAESKKIKSDVNLPIKLALRTRWKRLIDHNRICGTVELTGPVLICSIFFQKSCLFYLPEEIFKKIHFPDAGKRKQNPFVGMISEKGRKKGDLKKGLGHLTREDILFPGFISSVEDFYHGSESYKLAKKFEDSDKIRHEQRKREKANKPFFLCGISLEI